jgi:cyclopropane fatty-acyl-phospholipid synthase-like methyltransferase
MRGIPVIGPALVGSYVRFAERRFTQSAGYWENRYETGGNSGDGSYGKLAEFKAEVLNGLVEEFALKSVIELGCGDGNQLTLANYPTYLGLDVSQTALDMCRQKFRADSSKSFGLMSDFDGGVADVSLSLDVIFHLVEDEVFDGYMRTLFSASSKVVVIYASNTNKQESPKLPHVKHREFSNWVEKSQPKWSLHRVIENRYPYEESSGQGSPASFYIYLAD